jgi:hypothetical protein
MNTQSNNPEIRRTLERSNVGEVLSARRGEIDSAVSVLALNRSVMGGVNARVDVPQISPETIEVLADVATDTLDIAVTDGSVLTGVDDARSKLDGIFDSKPVIADTHDLALPKENN